MPHKPARPTTPSGVEAQNDAIPAAPNMPGVSPEQFQLLQNMLAPLLAQAVAPLQAQLAQLAERNQELEERQQGQADLHVRQATWGPQDHQQPVLPKASNIEFTRSNHQGLFDMLTEHIREVDRLCKPFENQPSFAPENDIRPINNHKAALFLGKNLLPSLLYWMRQQKIRKRDDAEA